MKLRQFAGASLCMVRVRATMYVRGVLLEGLPKSIMSTTARMIDHQLILFLCVIIDRWDWI